MYMLFREIQIQFIDEHPKLKSREIARKLPSYQRQQVTDISKYKEMN